MNFAAYSQVAVTPVRLFVSFCLLDFNNFVPILERLDIDYQIKNILMEKPLFLSSFTIQILREIFESHRPNTDQS